MFLHFGINTFCDQEWTDGSIPAERFAPSGLDPEQWVKAAKAAGMKYVVFTAKHHDGFCLWNSSNTSYGVARSPWKKDVVKAVSDACRKNRMGFGIYYSLWDRNRNPKVAEISLDASYNDYVRKQITELMTMYGPICELWLDGAWEKSANRWEIPRLYDLVKRKQANCQVAVNWTIGKPDNPDAHEVRPESQNEGDPIRYFPSDFRLADPFLPTATDPQVFSHQGERYFLPFETTLCISDKWFFNTEDRGLKPLDQLVDLYRQATRGYGRLVLNVPPARDGLLRQADVMRLTELGKALRRK